MDEVWVNGLGHPVRKVPLISPAKSACSLHCIQHLKIKTFYQTLCLHTYIPLQNSVQFLVEWKHCGDIMLTVAVASKFYLD